MDWEQKMKKIFQGFCTKRKRKNIYEHENTDWKQKKLKKFLQRSSSMHKNTDASKKTKTLFQRFKKKRENIYGYKYPDWNQKTKKVFQGFWQKKRGKYSVQ